MPFITTYGLGVSLQTTKPAGISSSNSTTDDEVLDESRFTQHWQPSKGMTHPIYTSTVLSPQASTKSLRTPFKIVVEFNPDEEMPAYMRGDVRVEALVDGIPCGLRVLREVKFRGKGFRVEFGGFRVGRTEERALVFNKLPKHLQKPLPGKKDSDEDDFDDDRIPNLGAPWTDNAVGSGNPGFDDSGVAGNDCCRYPEQPEGVPNHVSHIEILISVGKKFLTLEKYFMAGATQMTAFYHPPKPWTMLDPKEWKPPTRTSAVPKSKITGTVASNKGSSKPGATNKSEEEDQKIDESPLAVGTKTFNAAEKPSTWKPIGLSPVSRKCQQAKEVEYSARMHLVRFWLFIVPSLNIGNANMNSSSRHRQRSRIVILRLSPANLAAFSDPPLMLKSDQNDNDHLDPALRAKDAQPSFFDTALNAMEIMIPAPQSVVRGGSVASTTDSLSTIQSDDPRLDLSSCEIAPICSMTPNTLGKRTAAEFQRDNDTKGQMEPETDGSENRSKKAKQTDETSAAAPINDGEDIDAPHELDDGYSRSAVNNASV